jgi:ankyrin repeat protein
MDIETKTSPNPKEQAVIKILQEKGNINQRLIQFNYQSPLLLLADNDKYHDTLVQVLQNEKLMIHARDSVQATALHKAARGNAVMNLKSLIEHCKRKPCFELSSFLDARTSYKKTALLEAVENYNHICTGILLLHGAKLNLQNNNGLTEIHVLLQKPICSFKDPIFERCIKILLLLYAYGADFNAQNKIKNSQIKTKNAFSAIEYSGAWKKSELQRKQKLQTIIHRLRLITIFGNNSKNNNYFQSLLPADARWNIYNFIMERYLPRPNRL